MPSSSPVSAPEAPDPSVPFGKSQASVSLDAIRGIAALLVFLMHWRHIFFLELHELPAYRKLMIVPYFLTVMGHQAVILFFVLSGFLVGGTVVRALNKRSWSWKQYLTHRMVRLWLVLLPALAIGAIWDHDTVQQDAKHDPTQSEFVHQVIVPHIVETANPLNFLENFSFIQGLELPHITHFPITRSPVILTFGSNGALWSLADEFWYYILFPLAILIFKKEFSPIYRGLCAISLLLVACIVGHDVLLLFPIWLAGVVLVFLPRLKCRPWVRTFATVAYLGLFVGCTALARPYALLSDYLLGVFTTVYLWVLLTAAHQPARAGRSTSVSRNLARFSYTLYLVHMPLLYWIASHLVRGRGFPITIHALLLSIACGLVILLYAYCFACLTEFQTDRVKNWVEKRIGLHVRKQPLPNQTA